MTPEAGTPEAGTPTRPPTRSIDTPSWATPCSSRCPAFRSGQRFSTGPGRRRGPSGAGPASEEGVGDDGGVVGGNLLEDQKRERVARQGQRVTGPVGDPGD